MKQDPLVTTPESYRALLSKGIFSPEVMAPPRVIINMDGPDPNRLCSADHACGHGEHDHGGCRRTDTILAWEQENLGQYLPSNLNWGFGDLYFTHKGFMYYEKNFLAQVLRDDKANTELDRNNSSFKSLCWETGGVDPEFDMLNRYADSLILSLDDVRELIAAKPIGLPPFVRETEHFFVFEDVTQRKITVDMLNHHVSNLINQTFNKNGTDYGYTCYEPIESMYMRGDFSIYLVDLTAWIKFITPNFRRWFTLGFSIETDTELRFYPFSKKEYLSPQESRMIEVFCQRFAKESNKKFNLTNL